MLPKGPSWKCQTAAWLLHVYSEWLTGDAVWSIHDQLPQGATVLGTVLSSDKTNITTMTGARVTHLLLLGLANIYMCTRMKLLSKSPEPDNNLLTSIDRSLALFHDNKDVIMTLDAQMGVKRVIDNWHIPKLELMQSITTSTCQVGALIQWSTDATEHVHISKIKDPVQHTNNNNYDPQICLATSLKNPPTDPDLEELCEDEEDEDEDEEENGENDEPMDPQTALLEELNHTHTTFNYFSKIRILAATRHGIPQAHPPCTFLAGSTAVHLNCNPTYTGLKIDNIANQFNIQDLWHALSDFFQHDARNRDGVFGVGVPRRLLINHPLNIPFECVQVWHTVHLQ
ncbi:hypothetical protein EV424DRAFT_1343248 [Suillus variegatus]|nr:hypothetical protein EV424DRAFT_1343248 [Suillus variegatus]